MEKFWKFFTFSLFAALIVFASCGDDDDDDDNDTGPDPVEDVVNDLLADGGQWTITAGSPTLETVAAEGWDAFSLQLAGSTESITFTTSGAADNTVWPVNGSWTFVEGSNGLKGLRDDGIEIDITVSSTSLLIGFDITDGRTNGIVGRWSFAMGK